VHTVGHVAGHFAARGPTLAGGLDAFRLILHVLAATVWVGGQFTLAGLLPTIRTLGDDAPKRVAQAFGRLLWPAYAVLVITGFWNIGAVDISDASTAWKTVLFIKIGVVALAGTGVYLHQQSTTRRSLAVWGAVGAIASVAALGLGVVLAG